MTRCIANQGDSDVVRITVPPGDGNVVIGGRLYQRQPTQQQYEHTRHAPPPTPHSAPYPYQTSSRPHSRTSSSVQHSERVMPSIEQIDQRQVRVDHYPQHSPAGVQHAHQPAQRGIAGNSIDLTSPRSDHMAQQQQPLWSAEDRRSGFVHASVAPIQYVPNQQQNGRHYESPSRVPMYQSREFPPAYGGARPQQVIYIDPTHGTPQPVHGAPAPVQQIPKPASAQMPPLDARYANRYVHPGSIPNIASTQFYYPR